MDFNNSLLMCFNGYVEQTKTYYRHQARASHRPARMEAATRALLARAQTQNGKLLPA